jgi:cobalt-zinc-cadmium efflux system membrane fusion protein
MLANFVIELQNPVEGTAVPVTAVVRESDSSMTAWVTADRRHFTQRIVTLNLQTDGWYQVVNGLNRGELVVTNGAVFLSSILLAPPSD